MEVFIETLKSQPLVVDDWIGNTMSFDDRLGSSM